MQVKDVMHRTVRVCGPETNLTTAAGLMWEADCGSLPVMDEQKHVVGMITDRDICMGAALKHRAPDEIAVSEVTTGQVYSCEPSASVTDALELMKERHVHRLPVIAKSGELEGIVSMTDLVTEAVRKGGDKKAELPYEVIVHTFKEIREPQVEPAE